VFKKRAFNLNRACDLAPKKSRKKGTNAPSDSHSRSLSKAISWRVVGTLDTFLIGWLVTGEASLATAIAGIEVITKVGLFYLHERAWNKF
jgi:uncharacterized membrane protein